MAGDAGGGGESSRRTSTVAFRARGVRFNYQMGVPLSSSDLRWRLPPAGWELPSPIVLLETCYCPRWYLGALVDIKKLIYVGNGPERTSLFILTIVLSVSSSVKPVKQHRNISCVYCWRHFRFCFCLFLRFTKCVPHHNMKGYGGGGRIDLR